MRGLKRNPWLFGLGVLLAVLVVYGGHARADVTTDQSGSIIVFPKVVADGARDTLIQIANTDTMPANAHCIYTNYSGNCSVTTTESCNLDTDCPSGPPAEVCVHQCLEVNFDIFLTAQQPTTWLASTGRSGTDTSAGFPPGLIKPVCDPFAGCAADPFIGMLKCIETDSSGAPVGQNSLKGEAIIVGDTFGALSEYNAVGVLANSNGVNGSNTVLLDGQFLCTGGTNAGHPCAPLSAATDCPGSGATCDPSGAFNACPADLILNSSTDGAVDSFTDAVTATELTLVPCTDLVEQQPPSGAHALAQFEIVTDMEVRVGSGLSASKPFDCMWNSFISDINVVFLASSLGSDTIKTRIRPPRAGSCSGGSNSGDSCNPTTAAIDCPGGSCVQNGECFSGDNRCHLCTVNDTDPQCAGQNPGVLVGGPGLVGCSCTTDADCPNFVSAGTGACILSSPAPCTQDTDCISVAGCSGNACTCLNNTCTVTPPGSCSTSGDCAIGQTCSGPGHVSLGCRPYPGLVGVAEEFQFPASIGSLGEELPPPPGTAAVNLHMEGSRPGDVILLP